MSKNMVELERPQMTIWRMRDAFWIIKATPAHAHAHPPKHTREYARIHKYITTIDFPRNSGSLNATYCFVRTFPLLLSLTDD
jgi:hypothetical protein